MTDEVSPEEKEAVRRQYAFEAAIDQATRGKPAELVKLLRADYPLTAEHKAQLADFHEGKHKRKQGNPRKLFSKTDKVRRVAEEIHSICKRHRRKHTQEDVLDLMIFMELVPEDYCEAIITKLRRGGTHT